MGAAGEPSRDSGVDGGASCATDGRVTFTHELVRRLIRQFLTMNDEPSAVVRQKTPHCFFIEYSHEMDGFNVSLALLADQMRALDELVADSAGCGEDDIGRQTDLAIRARFHEENSNGRTPVLLHQTKDAAGKMSIMGIHPRAYE